MSDDALREKALDFLQSPPEAMRASTVVIEMLSTIDGYADIPPNIQTLIEQQCAVIYAAGFMRALRKANEIDT